MGCLRVKAPDGPMQGAREAGGKGDWTKAQLLPAGRVGNGVPTSQGARRPRAGRTRSAGLLSNSEVEFSGTRVR